MRRRGGRLICWRKVIRGKGGDALDAGDGGERREERGAEGSDNQAYLMRSFPFLTLRVDETAPRLTEPLYPPTLRQMLHAHSWYGTGV